MKIYLVGDDGPEHNQVVSAHQHYYGALQAWNNHRLLLLKETQESLDQYENKDLLDPLRKMYTEMIEKLKEEDHKVIDCFPHDTPYIREMELLE